MNKDKKRGIEVFWLRQWQVLNPHDCSQHSQNRGAAGSPELWEVISVVANDDQCCSAWEPATPSSY